MNLIVTVLGITAPVFLLAAIGFGWVKLGYDYPVQFVTRFATVLAVPCLIFSALMQTTIDPAALADLALATCVAYAAITGVMAAVVAAFGLRRQTFLAPLIYGNTGNLGLPMALFAFGDEGLAYAIVIFAIMAVMTFTLGIWMVAGRSNPAQVLREPILIGTLLGALFLWQGWQTPVWLTNAIELLGQLAIPLMLVTLGVAVSRLEVARLGQAAVLSVFKAVLCGGAGLAAGWVMELEPVLLAVLFLQTITPVAVTSYLLAERYNAGAQDVAGMVLVSTLLSVVTFPLALAWLL